MRKRRAVDALGAEHVDVVELGELLRCEGLRGAEHHVPGIVHDHVDAAVLGDDFRDAGVDRRLRVHVELERAQVDAVLLGVGFEIGHLRRVAARGLPHRGIDGVSRVRERICRQPAEAAGGSRDDDDLPGHDLLPYSKVHSQRTFPENAELARVSPPALS
jgi:hypothetical protein